jgi:sulfate transport system permease protein
MVRRILIGIALLFMTLMVVVPLSLVFIEAFSGGWATYFGALLNPETLSALRLSLVAVVCAVTLNTWFGMAAAWYITRYPIRGKNLLTSLIELPISISPVISGMLFVLLFGTRSDLGNWLVDHGIRIIFAPAGIVLATTFVTLPFVARELISLMQAQGTEEEEAAYLLGASGFQIFRKITLPNILPALFYGGVLTAARALGEFGAVSVVSGHIRGLTNTLPLQIEELYNDYQFAQAFAVASILMGIFGLYH